MYTHGMGRWKLFLLAVSVGAGICICFAQSTPDKGDVTRGKEVFLDHCDECHDAYSKEEREGPGLQGIKDGKLPDGRPATHDALLDVINTGPAEMPSFKDRLTDQQKDDVIAFVMTL
jgi:mono/diheme cytochrome c family protein